MIQATPEEIGIVMLAAGQSRRFGGDKRQALMPDGRTLLEASIEAVPDSLSKRVLVLHPGDDDLAARFSDRWDIVMVGRAHAGMGDSLASAVRHVDDWAGLLVALGDMPAIAAQTFTAIQTRLCSHPLVIPRYRGKRGHPVGFGKTFFARLAGLKGDRGARDIMLAHRDDACWLEVEDAGILQDIDTPGALAELGRQA